MFNKEYYSTTEVAELLGVSRITVFNKIKNGIIAAKKVGRNFIIAKEAVAPLLDGVVSEQDQWTLNQAVKKVVGEYGETLKLLGAE